MGTTRLLVLGAVMAGARVLFAQGIYSNGSSDASHALGASAVSTSGVPAPAGSLWSEAPRAGSYASAVAGFAAHDAETGGAFRFADDFTVPSGEQWTLSSLTVYAYQNGAIVQPFDALTVRVWIGRPGGEGSFVVWGDDTTNRAEVSVSTGVYRIFNSSVAPMPQAPDTSRLIWATRAGMGNLVLGAGTYWVDWQYGCVNADGGAYCPTVTVPGSRPAGNAVQLRPGAGIFAGGWVEVVDPGKPAAAPDIAQDLPFVLNGAIEMVCDPDVNCDGVPDQGDVACLILAVAGDMSCFCRADPDFNRDGVADQGDVADVLVVVAGAPCP